MKLCNQILNSLEVKEALPFLNFDVRQKRIELKKDVKTLDGELMPKGSIMQVTSVDKVGSGFSVEIRSFDGLIARIKISKQDARKAGLINKEGKVQI